MRIRSARGADASRLIRLLGIQLRGRHLTVACAVLLVVLGVSLRARQYAAGRSLWLDEVKLASNIVQRSYADLVRPLDHNQGAPLFFLFAERACVETFGSNEYALRLVPFVAGNAGLVLMAFLALAWLGEVAAPLALGLFVVSHPLVYFASEAKQYSSDVTVALILLLTFHRTLQKKEAPGPWVAISAIGASSLWFSHPALFILAGIGLALALDVLLTLDWRRLGWLAAAAVCWGLSLLVLYVLQLRHLAVNRDLLSYWEGSFMPMPPWRSPSWFLYAATDFFKEPLVDPHLSVVAVAALLALMGCASLLARQWQFAVALAGPVLAAVAASGFHKYPFKGRLLLFASPIVYILIGEGLDGTRRALQKFGSVLAVLVCAALATVVIFQPATKAWEYAVHPNMREDLKPVMAVVGRERKSGDAVYVYYGAALAFRYYATDYGLKDGDYIVGTKARADPKEYRLDLEKIIGSERVWFVVAHNCFWCAVDEEAYYLEALDGIGTRTQEFRADGAAAYLYSLNVANHARSVLGRTHGARSKSEEAHDETP